MVREMISAGIAALCVNLADLLHRERAAIGQSDQSAHRPIDHAIDAPVLGVDDLGAERLTPWGLEGLYRLTDGRNRAQRPTLWASNLSLDRLLSYLSEGERGAMGARIHSRIVRGAAPIYHLRKSAP
jgi:DNA replication protein DnaC